MGNPVKKIVKGIGKVFKVAVPAIVGIVTENPWLAAAAGGAIGASEGGTRGAITGAIGAGVGSYAGNSMAFSTAQSIPAYVVGKSAYVTGMTAAGTYAGTKAAQQISMPYQYSQPTLSNGAPINIPTFGQLQNRAVEETRQAFNREGVYHLLNPFRRFNRDISLADRKKYPPLSKTMKERMRRRRRHA